MRFRFVSCALSAVVVATAAWSDVAAGLAGVKPIIAVPPLTGPGPFQMSPQEREALHNGQIAQSRARALNREAYGTIRSDPLSAAALWLIAAQKDHVSTRTTLLLAEQVTRRELGVEMALFQLAVRNGELARSFEYLDRGLMAHPDAAAQLFSKVIPALTDSDIRTQFVRYARRPWFNTLLRESALKAADSLSAARLITDAHLTHEQLEPALLPVVLARLIKEGAANEAAQLAVRTGVISEGSLENFAIAPATIAPEAKPLTWQFVRNDAVSWQLQDGTKLKWMLEPGRSAILAERVTLYRSGVYRLTQSLSGSDKRLLVIWELQCINPGNERRVWSQAIPLLQHAQQSEVEVSIPFNCPAQRWIFKGSANDLQISGDIILDGINISIK